MRIRFTPGDEIMVPLPGSGWLHVKMFETPLVEAPWGARILFCPVPKRAEWIANANSLGMKILTVSPRWSVQEVFDKLAAAFPRNFRLWNSGRDLVMTRGGIGLTLQSPQTAIVETAGKKTVPLVWTRQTPAVPQLPQGLHQVLEEPPSRSSNSTPSTNSPACPPGRAIPSTCPWPRTWTLSGPSPRRIPRPSSARISRPT
jgi:hypothetical protein